MAGPNNTTGSRRHIGKQPPTPARAAQAPRPRDAGDTHLGDKLPLPHDRDESNGGHPMAADKPDPVITQAKDDLDAGQVDTDMRVTPGLDATRRDMLVPGPGGKRPASGA